MADDFQKECSISVKDLNEKCGVESVLAGEDVVCDKEKEPQNGNCPSIRVDGQQQVLDGQPVDCQTVLTTFPVAYEDFRSSNPIQVSMIDGQVIHLTSRSVSNTNRKVRRVDDDNKCSEEITSRQMNDFGEKSLTLITSNDKTYILPPGLSSEGEYLLAEEVLCEDVLHSSNMLPEEQILTIPSPSSLEFATGTKPDVLAIAASEVFSDSCLNPPLQENRCLSYSGECQIPEKEDDNVTQKSTDEIYSRGCFKSHALSHEEPISLSDCIGLNRLTSSVTEKSELSKVKVDHIYLLDNNKGDQLADCKKNRFLKNGDVYNHSSKPSKWYIVPANLLHDDSKSVDGTTLNIPAIEEQMSNVKDKVDTVEAKEDAVPEKTLEYLQPLSVEGTYVSDGCSYESSSSNQMTTGTKLRRSPRILKVKKDPILRENMCLEEPHSRKKRRAVKGDRKKALWDCVKCDAMFRTRTSRARHMQEGHLFTCYMCKWQGLTKTEYEIHISTVHCSQKARCLTCRKDFPNYSEYKEHLEIKHPPGVVQNIKLEEVLDKSCIEGKDQSETDFKNSNQSETYFKNSNQSETDFKNSNQSETDFKNSNQLEVEDTDEPDYIKEKKTTSNGKSISFNGTRLTLDNIEIEEELQSDGKRGCPYCGKKFERHSRFIRHLNYHLGNKAFMCKFCKKSFVEKSGLEAHLTTHSPINEPCTQCGKIFKTQRTMKRHLRTHQNTVYSCDFCQKQFRHEESLRVHKSVHKEGGSGNICSFCEKDCKTPYYLQLHMTNKHEAPKFKCKWCDRSFKWKQSYYKHMAVHNDNSSAAAMKYKCTTCQRRFMTFSDLNLHQFKHNEVKKHICDICGNWFKHEHIRDKHMRTVHREEREHMCPQCGALFKAKAYLDQHLAQVHTTKERVKCQTCGHDFKTESILKSHIKLVHNSANAKYTCQICKKAFGAPKDLARHNKVHTGEKNHICPVCRRCFSRKDNMTSHLRTHSRDMLEPITISQNTISDTPDVPQPTAQDPVEILGLPSVIPSSSTIVTSNNLQPMTSSSTNIIESDASLVSGSITISALPVPSISLPSSISSSLSDTLVYSNSSSSSTCIVLSSKPSSSTLPVVVFSGSSISNSQILSNSQPTLSSVSLGNIHSSINSFPINPPLTSLPNMSSATTLTYCNNISLAPSSSDNLCPSGKPTVSSVSQRDEQVVALHPYTASTSHPALSTATALPHFSLSTVTPVSSHSAGSNAEPVSQEPSVFSSSLHSEQIVLTEEVLGPTSTISS